jgi:hypothetical protein
VFSLSPHSVVLGGDPTLVCGFSEERLTSSIVECNFFFFFFWLLHFRVFDRAQAFFSPFFWDEQSFVSAAARGSVCSFFDS